MPESGLRFKQERRINASLPAVSLEIHTLGSDDGAMGINARRGGNPRSRGTAGWSGWRCGACIFVFAIAVWISGCGEEPKASTPAGPEVLAGGAAERRIAEMEKNLGQLETQTQALRAQTQDRLKEIDATRQNLVSEIAALRTELNLPGKPGSVSKTTPAKSAEEAAKPSRAPREHSRFLRLLLLIVIVGALIFIGRIVFKRWGPDAEDESFVISGGGPRAGSEPPGRGREPAPPDASDYDEP